jgi:N-terminal domain of galactosyltransferase
MGGVIVIPHHIFETVDGLWNSFWGWGKEDDEFQHRIVKFNISIHRPPKDIGTGPRNTFNHIHNSKRRPRDRNRCPNQIELGENRQNENSSLKNTEYKLVGTQELTIDGAKVTLLNVEAFCNKNNTPWCDPECPAVARLG